MKTLPLSCELLKCILRSHRDPLVRIRLRGSERVRQRMFYWPDAKRPQALPWDAGAKVAKMLDQHEGGIGSRAGAALRGCDTAPRQEPYAIVAPITWPERARHLR